VPSARDVSRRVGRVRQGSRTPHSRTADRRHRRWGSFGCPARRRPCAAPRGVREGTPGTFPSTPPRVRLSRGPPWRSSACRGWTRRCAPDRSGRADGESAARPRQTTGAPRWATTRRTGKGVLCRGVHPRGAGHVDRGQSL